MIIRSVDLPEGHVVRTEVAVVGSGPAGLAVALELVGKGRRVAVLESGHDTHDAATQSLNQGSASSSPAFSPETSRLRRLGGTTAVWSGRCLEFDAMDFERRDWIAHSGWPFSKDELAGPYDRARALLGLSLSSSELDTRAGRVGSEMPELAEVGLDVRFFDRQWGNIADLHGPVIRDHRDLEVYLGCTVTTLETEPAGGRITHLEAVDTNHRPLRVEASAVVLAGGGIENARLLLLSDGVHTGGLGNQHGLVGRYFMEHPYADGGTIDGGLPAALVGGETPDADRQQHALLVLSEHSMRSHGSAGAAAYLVERPSYLAQPPNRSDALKAVRTMSRARSLGQPIEARRYLRTIAPGVGQLGAHMIGRVVHAVRPDTRTVTRLVIEPVPNPDSAVTLTSSKDPLGLRRVRVDWRLSEQDMTTFQWLERSLDEMADRAGGRYRSFPEVTGDWPESLSEGKHHMGTTRMHADPKKGVVDPQCRVHGVGNLWVAGSSVFPTYGYANPTLTIVALAARLADDVDGALRPAAV